MIFITLGSQKFQFNRLLNDVDKMIEKYRLSEEVFAQIGYSDYLPKHFKYQKFIDREQFQRKMGAADLVITHGGTGAIISALKANKKVIACPRLSKYGEHVDDHQKQIIYEFAKMGYITPYYESDDLLNIIEKASRKKIKQYQSNTKQYINSISKYINGLK